MISSRCPDTTSWMVRLPNSARRPSFTVCFRRMAARDLVAAHRDVILLRIDDAPLDEGIHQHVLLFRGDETFRIGRIQRQDAGIEIAHVLHQRQLEIEARLGLDRHHFAQLEHQGILALIDGKQAATQHDQQHDQTDQKLAQGSCSWPILPITAAESITRAIRGRRHRRRRCTRLRQHFGRPAVGLVHSLLQLVERQVQQAVAALLVDDRPCWCCSSRSAWYRDTSARASPAAPSAYSVRICAKRLASPSALAITDCL